MKAIVLLGACAAVAACATPETRYPTQMPATSAPTAIDYDAVGPGWSLAIRSSSMTFQTDQGLATTDNYVEFMPNPDGDTYRGQKITATVTRQGCAIEGYDATVYPHRVTVMVNGQTLQGCGGPPGGNDREPY